MLRRSGNRIRTRRDLCHKVQQALAVVRERQQVTMQVLQKVLWG